MIFDYLLVSSRRAAFGIPYKHGGFLAGIIELLEDFPAMDIHGHWRVV